ncbi:hypothetical protein O181_084354 [Austropuccinia psidii MF-1]|uniref:Uncharacterized protein n=1 Tax=Austropuccinia psidii MF-1 TaxID=1389203 RepID=A0A9Q3FTB6_9BASI|nr:hypothetical protein [Austropuccinia psidii MF-1]
MKILKKCGGELERPLRSRCIEPCSTDEYINALEDIVTKTKIARTWKKFGMKIPNQPRKPFNANRPITDEQIKCHKCGGISHLANNLPKRQKINEIVETKDHNDKEDESDSEKDAEESEASEGD